MGKVNGTGNTKEITLANMEAALEKIRENPGIKLAVIAKQLDIHPSTITKWKTNDLYGWKEKYQEALRESFNNLEKPAIDCMAKLLEDGSFQAAKYVLDNKNYGAAQKIEANVNGDIDIQISIEE